MKKKYLLIASLLSFVGVNAQLLKDDQLTHDQKTIVEATKNLDEANKLETIKKIEVVGSLREADLHPEKLTTDTLTVKQKRYIPLVETTQTSTTHNWWKWLGLLALLGALLGFLSTTFRRRDYDKETNNYHPKRNRHSDREVEFTFEEEKEDKGSEKRHYNKDYKNRD